MDRARVNSGCCLAALKLVNKKTLCVAVIPLYVVIFMFLRSTNNVPVTPPPHYSNSPLSLKSSLAEARELRESGEQQELEKKANEKLSIPKSPPQTQTKNQNQTSQKQEVTRADQRKTQTTRDAAASDQGPQSDNRETPPQMDIHVMDPKLGHTGETIGHIHTSTAQIHRNSIAIGGGITSAKIDPLATKEVMLKKMPFFNVMLPTFCATCDTQFSYHFYLAYDYTDKLFANPQQLETFGKAFYEQVTEKCPQSAVIELHMVQCDHTKSPAWAQNDAMMEAYIDNMEYFYRINDDSSLKNNKWAEIFVQRLKQFDPPNLGVVGPFHAGGNVAILTYDFTHHTHQDMFGFHYPRDFPDWYADDWVTGVYKPGRVEKLKSVPLDHTMQLGQRYSQHDNGHKLKPRYDVDKVVMQRYARYLKSTPVKRDPSKVIAFSLFDKSPSQTVGALRNVQQAPVFFPEWTIRIYVPSPNVTHNAIPERLLNKMVTLGAQVYYMDKFKVQHSKESMAFHIIDDKSVQAVLIRDPEYRLSDRQKSAVDEWMDSTSMMHCMRDNPSHAALPIVTGLLGIKLTMLRDDPQQYEKLSKILTDSEGSLEKKLWEEYENDFLCHDSVSCDKWKNSKAFPVAVTVPSYEGQRYDEHMVSLLSYKYDQTQHKCKP